jgi:hypothetical protein
MEKLDPRSQGLIEGLTALKDAGWGTYPETAVQWMRDEIKLLRVGLEAIANDFAGDNAGNFAKRILDDADALGDRVRADIMAEP